MIKAVGKCPACKMVWCIARHCAYRREWEACVRGRLPTSATELHGSLSALVRRVSALHATAQANEVIKVALWQRQWQRGHSGSKKDCLLVVLIRLLLLLLLLLFDTVAVAAVVAAVAEEIRQRKCVAAKRQVEAQQIGRQVGHHLGLAPLLRYCGIIAKATHTTSCKREATGQRNFAIGGQQYVLQPQSTTMLRKLDQLIAFSRAVDRATAPADIAEWKSQARDIFRQVKAAGAPGFIAGGYHHLWLERLTRKMNMTMQSSQASSVVSK